jgi:molecular chaperone GrpE
MHEQPDPSEQPESGASADSERNRLAEIEAELVGARTEQLRLLAEMDNQRKRLARDAESARKYATDRLLADLIPVADSLEAGLGVQAADATKLREGMQLTLRLLDKALASNGVSTVDPLGAAFDPEAHQAMSMVEVPGQAAGTVVTVFQKGYRLNDRLLRPAMVAVARDPE